MKHSDAGFSLVEVLLVIVIMGIIAVFAIPGATHAVYNYRLHSDASNLAAQLNITRYRATSQYSPYSLTLAFDSTVGRYSMTMQRLCGNHTPTSDCGTATAGCSAHYASYANEGGAEYISQTDSFTATNPGGTVFPGSITAASTPPSGSVATFYFNTRGMPVGCDGLPVSNGGAVAYISSSQVAITDAVVVSVAGLVSIYQWDPGSSQWIRR